MIYKKLLELQTEGLALSKNAIAKIGDKFTYKYITLDKILDTYLPLLSEKKLLVMHQTRDNKVVTKIIDLEDESEVESEFNLLGNDPQKLGSCITYAKRYNLGQLLNIVTDEDDDGNKGKEGTKEKYTKEMFESQKEGINKSTKTKDEIVNNIKEKYILSSEVEKLIKGL